MPFHGLGHQLMMQCSPTYRMENMMRERRTFETFADCFSRINRKYDPPAPVMPKYEIPKPYPEIEKLSRGYETYIPKFPKYEPIKIKDSNDYILELLGRKKKTDYLSIYDPERYR